MPDAAENPVLDLVSAPKRPAVHIGLYGEPHAGKSGFAATLPTPMYVAFFDRRGKELTYLKYWQAKYGVLTVKEGTDKRGTPYMDYFVIDRFIGRIAHYTTARVAETDGVGRLMDYFPVLESEVAKGKWATVIGDSVTFMAYDARKQSQYIDNPTTRSGSDKNTLAWYGQSTDMIEEILCSLLPNLTCNTLAIMHESKVYVESEGGMVRSPAVPGKRLASTNMIAATFPELYRIYVERSVDGRKQRLLQTDSDEKFQAGSVLGAPDPCKPTYQALWEHWGS
jgi:hypothetical protein